MANVDEKTFAKAYLHLLSQHKVLLADDYVKDPKTLTARDAPVLLHHMEQEKKRRSEVKSAGDQEVKTVSVTVKSLRAPKFVLNFPEVSYTDTISALKSSVSKESGIPEGAIKLLIGGKVQKDITTIQELANDKSDISFMAMVSKDSSFSPDIPGTPTSAAVATGTSSLELSDDIWADIASVVDKHMGRDSREKVLERLKKGYELAK
ncbi:hypothetical protein V1511DRAFT_499019 [Dipodascopsis uninucleata]